MRTRRSGFPGVVALALLLATSRAVVADEPAAPAAATPPPAEAKAGHSLHGEVFNEGPRQQAYLMGTTGQVSIQITTKAPEAQAVLRPRARPIARLLVLRGRAFVPPGRVLDPDFAMAYWGMAMANRDNEKRGKGFIEEAVKRKPPPARANKPGISTRSPPTTPNENRATTRNAAEPT